MDEFKYSLKLCKESFEKESFEKESFEEDNKDNKDNKDRVALCTRSALAGKSLATLLAGGGRAPSMQTPDTSVAKRTVNGHPPAQCRLDTYFAGSLCRKNPTGEMGKVHPRDGYCHRDDKDEAHRDHARPLCWYKPTDVAKAEEQLDLFEDEDWDFQDDEDRIFY